MRMSGRAAGPADGQQQAGVENRMQDSPSMAVAATAAGHSHLGNRALSAGQLPEVACTAQVRSGAVCARHEATQNVQPGRGWLNIHRQAAAGKQHPPSSARPPAPHAPSTTRQRLRAMAASSAASTSTSAGVPR